ncbi:MAG: hypothetical protein WCO67_12635 [Betaproteobacteria bacterium]
MNMSERKFNSFLEAKDFAKRYAGKGKRISVRRNSDEGFIVFGDIDTQESATTEPQPETDWNDLMFESLKDFKKAQTREDCDQYIEAIKSDLDKVSAPAIKVEAMRTLRWLEQQIQILPPVIEIIGRQEQEKRERDLQKKAPMCGKCGIPLTLKSKDDSPSEYFWGCRNFARPRKEQCYVKKRACQEFCV